MFRVVPSHLAWREAAVGSSRRPIKLLPYFRPLVTRKAARNGADAANISELLAHGTPTARRHVGVHQLPEGIGPAHRLVRQVFELEEVIVLAK